MRGTILACTMLFLVSAVNGRPGQSPKAGTQQDQSKQGSMADCPMHDSHAAMDKRGTEAMGFSQTETTHHFFLTAAGGVIQVEANRGDDATNRDNIRVHLNHIAKMFAEGDFDIPMFVHATMPPGIPAMKQLKQRIRYRFETTPRGGRVVISSDDSKAVTAIHQFLRFQIKAHETGDAVKVTDRSGAPGRELQFALATMQEANLEARFFVA